MSQQQSVTYKNRVYRVVWRGPGKYGPGERLKLAFLDGSKTFFVDASKTATAKAPTTFTPGKRQPSYYQSSCLCEDDCCMERCYCSRECACKGGPIHDCMG